MAKSSVQFIEQFAVLLGAEGYPRVAGRLFGLLLLAPDTRSLDQLAKQLGVSKASVSVNIRILEQRGVVERVGQQGDRRDYYRIGGDILSRTIEQRIARLRRFMEAIQSARDTLAIGAPSVRRRLNELEQAYHHMLDVMTAALDEWRKPAASRSARHSP